jgi:hypothetical protein
VHHSKIDCFTSGTGQERHFSVICLDVRLLAQYRPFSRHCASGAGTDTFCFAPNFGQNTITNFNTAKDQIQLPHSEFADLAAVLADAHQVGANTVIADGNDVITLDHVALSNLHAHDFVLV